MKWIAWTFATSAVFLCASARAADEDDLSGQPCETSADCGPLKCIEDRCHDVAAIARGEDKLRTDTIGHRAMFGDGHGYGTAIAVTDVIATLTEPFLVLGAVSTYAPTSSTFGALAFVPTGLAGPIVHVIGGRYVPAVISFFAWTSLAGTTFVVGGLFGLAFENGYEFNSVAAWAAGLSFGAGGAVLVTCLDVWMARAMPSRASEKNPTTTVRVMPSIQPMRNGAMLSVGGIF